MNNIKKNGFTVVELIVSFTLVITICVFLFQLVLLLRNIYNNNDLKTELLNQQANFSDLIYKSLNNKDISEISKCGDTCIKFIYKDNTSEELNVDKDKKLIKYNNYSTYLPDNSNFGVISFDIISSNERKILKINVSIKNDKFDDKDFGLNIIYQFKEGSIVLSNF